MPKTSKKRVFQVTLQLEADDEFAVRNIAQRALGAAYVQPGVEVSSMSLWEVTGGKHVEIKTLVDGGAATEDDSDEDPNG